MLLALHRETDLRTGEIASSHGDWPCRKGCDSCCRRLAELPRLTRSEWEVLEEGLAELPAEIQRDIAVNLRAMEENDAVPRICPFLDRDAGSCRVYAHRPIACRTYGFYVER